MFLCFAYSDVTYKYFLSRILVSLLIIVIIIIPNNSVKAYSTTATCNLLPPTWYNYITFIIRVCYH